MTCEYFVLNMCVVVLKAVLNISNFHGKALRKKKLFSLFLLVTALVKFRNSGKGIANKLQGHSCLSSLVFFLHTKRHLGK